MGAALLLERFGRLHPLLLHLPIGLVAALVLAELVGPRGEGGPRRRVTLVLAWAAAVSAALTAGAGLALAREPGYAGSTVEWHERLGIAVAVGAVLAAVAHGRGPAGRRLGLYRALLVVSLAALVPAGHLGSELTHGPDWLAGPAGGTRGGAGGADTLYAVRIAPILSGRCGRCHGEAKQKGGLALHDPDAIRAGGDDGPVLAPGDPEASELVRRLRLPLEHEDHMPPEGQPQPGEAELARLEDWIRAGASFEQPAEAVAEDAPGIAVGDAASPPLPQDPEALAGLRAELVHVEPLERGSPLLWVDVAAVAPSFDDAAAARLFGPLVERIAELSLARSRVTDATLALCARMPRLERLDLRDTAVTSAGLAALAGHERLAELVLAGTRLDAAASPALQRLPALRRLVVTDAGLPVAARDGLAAARPDLAIEAGDEPPAVPLEHEGELVFTGDRPLPDGAVERSLEPVNATCPVSGQPVDARFLVVHQGRVVGFCCPNCPGTFWEDPARHPVETP